MNVSTSSFAPLMQVAPRPPVVFVRGQGSWMWDDQGRRHLDFVQGWAVNCLGHSPDVVVDALTRQARLLLTPSPAFYNEPSLKLAEALTRSSCFDQAFFASSGAEANEGAIKLARKYGALHRNGAFEIITFDGSFHGRTLTTMSASGKSAFRRLFEPKTPGFPKARLNDIASVERLISPIVVAVMIEPIQGEAGVWPATPEFLRELRSLTESRGLLLIFDEIQTGIGRTGALFDYQNAGVEPDILTLGKGIGGGAPLAALLAKASASCFEYGDQGGTYCGNPLMCAAGCAVLGAVDQPAFLSRVNQAGALLASELQRLSRRYGLGAVRGRGLLLALDLKSPCGPEIVAEAFRRGLLLNAPQPDALRFMPALNVTDAEIGHMIASLDAILADRCGVDAPGTSKPD